MTMEESALDEVKVGNFFLNIEKVINVQGPYGVQSPAKFNFCILLAFLAIDIVVLQQFVPTCAIGHSSFQFVHSIAHLTLSFSRFNFVV
jgi:hypothetical protein